MDRFQILKEMPAMQLHNAMVTEKSLELEAIATDATLAQQILFQMKQELLVLDQFQYAHALRDTLPTDTNVNNAQLDMS